MKILFEPRNPFSPIFDVKIYSLKTQGNAKRMIVPIQLGRLVFLRKRASREVFFNCNVEDHYSWMDAFAEILGFRFHNSIAILLTEISIL